MRIYGENHFKKESVEFIRNEIIKHKPEVLIHELVFDANLSVTDVIEELKNCNGKGYCDRRFNKDIFELCAELRIPLLGCDLSEKELESLKGSRPEEVRKRFKLREERMVKMFLKYQGDRVICVVGDTHLRQGVSTVLGLPSPIVRAVEDKRLVATIIRTRAEYREFD